MFQRLKLENNALLATTTILRNECTRRNIGNLTSVTPTHEVAVMRYHSQQQISNKIYLTDITLLQRQYDNISTRNYK